MLQIEAITLNTGSHPCRYCKGDRRRSKTRYHTLHIWKEKYRVLQKTPLMSKRRHTLLSQTVMMLNAPYMKVTKWRCRHTQKENLMKAPKILRLMTTASSSSISCKLDLIEDMTSYLPGREITLKIRRRTHLKRKHLLRRRQRLKGPPTKVRYLLTNIYSLLIKFLPLHKWLHPLVSRKS